MCMVTSLGVISLSYVSVPFNAQLIKYGVVSIQDLCHDLHHWNTLYISGRLHKPVRALHYSVILYVGKFWQRNNWQIW